MLANAKCFAKVRKMCAGIIQSSRTEFVDLIERESDFSTTETRSPLQMTLADNGAKLGQQSTGRSYFGATLGRILTRTINAGAGIRSNPLAVVLAASKRALSWSGKQYPTFMTWSLTGTVNRAVGTGSLPFGIIVRRLLLILVIPAGLISPLHRNLHDPVFCSKEGDLILKAMFPPPFLGHHHHHHHHLCHHHHHHHHNWEQLVAAAESDLISERQPWSRPTQIFPLQQRTQPKTTKTHQNHKKSTKMR